MYQFIQYQIEQGVATIVLNRPEVFNALNNGLKEELLKAFQDSAENNEVRVIILTGKGKAFSSGQDLKAAATELQNHPYSEAIRQYYNPLILQMRSTEKPIICRLNGIAAGAGCSLALACDLVVASDQAMMTELFVGIGLVMDSGSTYFLPRLVGSQKAFELATMATKISAEEGARLGLINKVVPEDQLDAAVMRYVEYYLHAPTRAVGMIKKLLNQSHHSSLEEVLEMEAQWQDVAAATEDHKEGVRAFLEKRAPQFKGR